MIKKQPFITFLPKKQRIYDYFYEFVEVKTRPNGNKFASEALHIVIFENFVQSMTSCSSKLKVTPSFCFAFKIPDDMTASTKYCAGLIILSIDPTHFYSAVMRASMTSILTHTVAHESSNMYILAFFIFLVVIVDKNIYRILKICIYLKNRCKKIQRQLKKTLVTLFTLTSRLVPLMGFQAVTLKKEIDSN